MRFRIWMLAPLQAPARVGLRSSRSEKWKKEAFTLFREVQSEKNMLSLFFEKCKVKKICFHSFSRSEKWNQNASRPRSRSENSREFLTILEKRDFTTELFYESQKRLLKQMACSSSGNHHHFDILTIEKSESLFKGAASFLFADLTAGQLFLLILASYLGNEKSES